MVFPLINGNVQNCSGSVFAGTFYTFTDDLLIKFVRIFTELGRKGSGKNAAGTFP